MPRILLIGAGGNKDRSDHFGCHLVADALFKAFKPIRAIPVWDRSSNGSLSDIDFVIVNAEGSTHSGRNKHLYRRYEKPAVLINAVWQNNPAVDLSHFLFVSTRESLSAEAMKGCGVKPLVVPDVMLSHELESGSGGGLVVSDSVTDKQAGFPVRRRNLDTFLNADQLVCGRFHAACLALITNKPFSCYPSNTWKTDGMMRDAGLSNYYKTRDKAIRRCPSEPDPKAAEYLVRARKQIAEMINHVKELACSAA